MYAADATRHWAASDRIAGLTRYHVSLSPILFCDTMDTCDLFEPGSLPSLISLAGAGKTGGAGSHAATSLVVPAGGIFAFLGFAVRIRSGSAIE